LIYEVFQETNLAPPDQMFGWLFGKISHDKLTIGGDKLSYKTFYGRNLRIFLVS
jgi:hypothetical protein